MKLSGIERGILTTIVVMVVALVLMLVALNRAVKAEFGDCKGLKGAVEKVWDGTECVPK